jgi:putative endopeptidase
MSSRRTSARGAVIALALLAAPSLGLAAEPPRVDATVRPGDDFYRYANGPWLAETPRPPGAANYDTGTQLRDRAARQVRDLIESLARAPAGRRHRPARR